MNVGGERIWRRLRQKIAAGKPFTDAPNRDRRLTDVLPQRDEYLLGRQLPTQGEQRTSVGAQAEPRDQPSGRDLTVGGARSRRRLRAA